MPDIETSVVDFLPPKIAAKMCAHQVSKVVLTPTDTPPTLRTSQLGGIGYLPATVPYPFSRAGEPLQLLAQINFAELPKLPDFPEQGILAFYINPIDDLLGLDHDAPTDQNDFRVFYFSDIAQRSYSVAAVKSVLSCYDSDETDLPVEQPCALTGELAVAFPGDGDTVACYRTFGIDADQFYDRLTDMMRNQDLLNDILGGNEGTHLGGLAGFVQGDPRDEQSVYDQVLFQLDSNTPYVEIGDAGILNFFINRAKLVARDFSDVLYHWDCG